MQTFDWMYLIGVVPIWVGSIAQIYRLIQLKDARSLSIWWPLALILSFAIRLPLAASAHENYPIWGCCYVVSLLIALIMAFFIIHYKLKGRKGRRHEG